MTLAAGVTAANCGGAGERPLGARPDPIPVLAKVLIALHCADRHELANKATFSRVIGCPFSAVDTALRTNADHVERWGRRGELYSLSPLGRRVVDGLLDALLGEVAA